MQDISSSLPPFLDFFFIYCYKSTLRWTCEYDGTFLILIDRTIVFIIIDYPSLFLTVVHGSPYRGLAGRDSNPQSFSKSVVLPIKLKSIKIQRLPLTSLY